MSNLDKIQAFFAAYAKKDVAAVKAVMANDIIWRILVITFWLAPSMTDRALASVRDGGRAAFPSGVMPEPKIPSGVRQGIYNVTVNREAIEKLKRLIEAGPFEVHVARTFPLGNAAEAHRALSQHYLGKLALRVSA